MSTRMIWMENATEPNVERAKGRFFIKYIALMIRFMFRMFRENTIGTSRFIQ